MLALVIRTNALCHDMGYVIGMPAVRLVYVQVT